MIAAVDPCGSGETEGFRPRAAGSLQRETPYVPAAVRAEGNRLP